MIRVSVEVCSGAACFRVVAWAESIKRAVSLAKAHYPEGEVRIIFPIEPDAFFAKGETATCELMRLEAQEKVTR